MTWDGFMPGCDVERLGGRLVQASSIGASGRQGKLTK